MDTVLAETVFTEIVIVLVIVLLPFWSLNPGRFFETTCVSNGIPSYNVGNDELNGQTLAVNVFNMYVKVSEFNAELELNMKHKHKICFAEDCYPFFPFIVFSAHSSPEIFWARFI